MGTDKHKVNDNRRQSCHSCHRPASNCICDLAQKINNHVKVHLLQHPKEAKHPKGSAILLQLSLKDIETWQGEYFPNLEAELSNENYYDLLLYPELESQDQKENGHCLNRKPRQTTRLWVLDGTWKKAYKILQLNPALQKLPKVSPAYSLESQYEIRKAPKKGQLSTLEACCYTLSELENTEKKYDSLLNSFMEFNRRWQNFSQA
ncbi:tRNA-uridine aminocarboxypropyltransferase [uncultured Pseudoteredinibacter sp.]|uniref:tRNA-uridine aminocarboxypropyltransferase n=1 Tax=uncultured Pseudoteredinibacter sp. TaxID=1641701 RepID=UPI00262AD79D|nr:tRNA-uridine aminocarboxypropyltransferase [uncultured Pseudoteredinibacter sp.]